MVENIVFFLNGILKVVNGIQSNLWKCPLQYFKCVVNSLITIPQGNIYRFYRVHLLPLSIIGFKCPKAHRCWHCRALGQDIWKPGVTYQQWQLCQSFETHLQDPFTSHNPRKFCPHQSKHFYSCSALERSEKIKIVNCNFHKENTYHVTVQTIFLLQN